MARKVPARPPAYNDPADRPLTPRQMQFALHYLACGNAAKAARDAGYAAGNGTRSDGAYLRWLPQVAKFIDAELENRRKRLRLSADRVLMDLVHIAELDIADMYDADGNQLPIQQWPPHFRQALAGVTITPVYNEKGEKVREHYQPIFQDRTEALHLIGKHIRMFVETIEHSGPYGAPISIEHSKAALVARILEMRREDENDPALTSIRSGERPALGSGSAAPAGAGEPGAEGAADEPVDGGTAGGDDT